MQQHAGAGRRLREQPGQRAVGELLPDRQRAEQGTGANVDEHGQLAGGGARLLHVENGIEAGFDEADGDEQRCRGQPCRPEAANFLPDKRGSEHGRHASAALPPAGCSAATKISSSVNDSVLITSGERVFKRSTTRSASPSASTSISRPFCFSTRAAPRSSVPCSGVANRA